MYEYVYLTYKEHHPTIFLHPMFYLAASDICLLFEILTIFLLLVILFHFLVLTLKVFLYALRLPVDPLSDMRCPVFFPFGMSQSAKLT